MRLHRSILAVQLVVFWAFPAFGDSLDTYPSLRESFDPGLQQRVERTLAALRLTGAVRDKRLSVALVDISDLEDPRVASVNGDEMMYAASLPKIAILLAAFVQIEAGSMELDRATRESLTRMVRMSSNSDATRMLNRVGKNKLLNLLRSERFRLYDPQVNGGLWIGKEYGKSPAYRRDPLHNLSHGATAMQVARFYYLLETRRLVEPGLSREMKGMLGKPGINHKFVKGLAQEPGVKIFRKSGSWRQWHSDSAIVEAGKYRYIVVALAEDGRGSKWLSQMIKPLHRLVVPTTVTYLR